MDGGTGLDLAMPKLARLGLALIEHDARCCGLGKAFFTDGPIFLGRTPVHIMENYLFLVGSEFCGPAGFGPGRK